MKTNIKENAKFPIMFLINGVEKKGVLKPPSCFVNLKIFSEYVKIISIGEPNTGFDVMELPSLLQAQMSGNEQEINIIFNMHDLPPLDNEKYVVGTSRALIPLNEGEIQQKLSEFELVFMQEKQKIIERIKDYKNTKSKLESGITTTDNEEEMQKKLREIGNINFKIKELTLTIETVNRCYAKEKFEVKLKSPQYDIFVADAEAVIMQIRQVTKDIPLKIFVINRYGNNLQNLLHLLPAKSILITLSDMNYGADTIGFSDVNHESHLASIFKQGFKIEGLLEFYCMNQRIFQNTPKIGLVSIDGKQHVISLGDYVSKHANQLTNVPEVIQELLSANNTDLAYLTSLLQSRPVQSLKFKEDLNLSIVYHYAYQTLLQEYKRYIETITDETNEIKLRKEGFERYKISLEKRVNNKIDKMELKDDFINLYSYINKGKNPVDVLEGVIDEMNSLTFYEEVNEVCVTQLTEKIKYIQNKMESNFIEGLLNLYPAKIDKDIIITPSARILEIIRRIIEVEMNGSLSCIKIKDELAELAAVNCNKTFLGLLKNTNVLLDISEIPQLGDYMPVYNLLLAVGAGHMLQNNYIENLLMGVSEEGVDII